MLRKLLSKPFIRFSTQESVTKQQSSSITTAEQKF